MIGRTLGGYRITEQIGMGGMATVYKAYDANTDRYVAIKTLPQQYSQDEAFRNRFQREAKAITRLEHLHILPVFAYGEDEGIAYMVMRYMNAGSLTELIKTTQLKLSEISRLLSQVASALDYAHMNGIIHRDVKTSNILVDKQGNAYLTDFGIAKIVEGTTDLTGSAILGTPQYMSPEQCRGDAELTPATDQYSLGVVLYEMVTGRVPYQAETPMAVIRMHLLGEPLSPPSILRLGFPPAAEQVILKALSHDANARYPSCSAMAEKFTEAICESQATDDELTLRTNHPPRERAINWVYVIALLLAVSLIAAAAFVVGIFAQDDKNEAIIASTPVVIAERDGIAARSGAGTDFPIVATLVTGEAFDLVGISQDSAWYQIIMPDGSYAWITSSASMVNTFGEIALVPSIQNPQPALSIEATEAPSPQIGRIVNPCEIGEQVRFCIFDSQGKQLEYHDVELTGFVPQNYSWSPDGENLVFSVCTQPQCRSESRLYIINADGTGLMPLPQRGNDLNPSWSTDGEWIAYHSSCELVLIHPDGKGQRAVMDNMEGTRCALVMRWSPESPWLAVLGFEEGGERASIWMVQAHENTLTRLYTTTDPIDNLVWTPSGELAFQRGNQWQAFNPTCLQDTCEDEDIAPIGTIIPQSGFPNFYPQWQNAE